jgi:hypothetical protein
METIRSSETSVYTISTRRHIPEDGLLQTLLDLLCLHYSLPGDGSQQCPLFRCPRSYGLATVSLAIDSQLTQESESESELVSEILYDWRFTVNQFVLAPSPLRFMTRDIFFFFATDPLRL